MQAENENRRAAGVRRVELSTLVEICGRAPGVPAFEAESVEVSGRGMHVRTKFLPALGDPLVLRFEHEGREVVVEGEVAWRQETEHGRDFGIKFTALDGRSVGVLKQLCGPGSEGSKAPPSQAQSTLSIQRGAPVKLHIGGLGAPMKARVCDGGPRKLNVGSQLEFLRVGRTLELEDVSAGAKRGAHIESVSIAIDPQTHIPQLVVSLRYEGEEVTPEPTVVDAAPREKDDQALTSSHHRPAPSEAAEQEDDEDFDDDDAVDAAEALFRSRVERFISGAGGALNSGGARARVATASIAGGINALLDRARAPGNKPSSMRRTTRASTSPSPAARRDASRSLRPQHQKKRVTEVPPYKRPKFIAMVSGAAAIFVSGAYVLSTGDSHQEEKAPAAPALVAANAAIAAPSVILPGQFPPPAALSTEEQARVESGAIVAEVPLFGATPMATVEAAPQMPLRDSQIDEYSLAKDQVFSDSLAPGAKRSASARPATEPEPATEGQTQWQVGRLHLPIVHRLRLDAPGVALQGEKTATGFTVVIPGRQVKENGSGIVALDDRIAQVRVKNTPAGGKVMFRFQKEVPGYKVRLRNDFVEFFINSPEQKTSKQK